MFRSSLKIVPYSHSFGVTIQQVFDGTSNRAKVADDYIVAFARTKDERSGVVNLDTRDGQAVVFYGRLWHGSDNLRRFGTRSAVLLQYASTATAMRIPNLEHLRGRSTCSIPRGPRASLSAGVTWKA